MASPLGSQSRNALKHAEVVHKNIFEPAQTPHLSSKARTAMDRRRRLSLVKSLHVSRNIFHITFDPLIASNEENKFHGSRIQGTKYNKHVCRNLFNPDYLSFHIREQYVNYKLIDCTAP